MVVLYFLMVVRGKNFKDWRCIMNKRIGLSYKDAWILLQGAVAIPPFLPPAARQRIKAWSGSTTRSCRWGSFLRSAVFADLPT